MSYKDLHLNNPVYHPYENSKDIYNGLTKNSSNMVKCEGDRYILSRTIEKLT